MKKFLKKLITVNKRDLYGLLGWFLVSVVIGIIAIPIMVGREIYQWKHYHLPEFEWDDVVRYSLVIFLGSIVNYSIIGLP